MRSVSTERRRTRLAPCDGVSRRSRTLLVAARRTIASALLVLAGVGCSSYEERWEEALLRSDAHGVEGAWLGTWTSDVNAHTGGLRAIVTRLEDERLRVDYHATYELLFELSFEYGLEMSVRREGELERFEGDADLGWLAGGLYTYEGESDGTRFDCVYRAESDHGTFSLRRP